MTIKNRFCICAQWHISECGGGAEVQACYLAEELVRIGHHVDYICFTKQQQLSDCTTVLNGVNIHWMPYKMDRLGMVWLFQQQHLYSKKLHEIRPNIIVLRLSPAFTYAIGKYVQYAKVPFVWICTDDISCGKKVMRASRQLYPLKPKNVISYLNGCIFDFFRNQGMKYVSLAFTQNDYQATQVKQTFGLDSYRMLSGHLVPQHRITPHERLKKKCILWCANLGKSKRPELFITLAKKMISSDFRFVMVGGHSDRQYTEQLFREKSENLIWTGSKSFEESLTFFDDATFFVNTSSPGGDGFPNTFVQAWIRGVPVFSIDINPSNILVDHKLGFVCNDINDMSMKMKSLINDEQLYGKLSLSCQEYAYRHHSLTAMCENFLDCLKDSGIAGSI